MHRQLFLPACPAAIFQRRNAHAAFKGLRKPGSAGKTAGIGDIAYAHVGGKQQCAGQANLFLGNIAVQCFSKLRAEELIQVIRMIAEFCRNGGVGGTF